MSVEIASLMIAVVGAGIVALKALLEVNRLSKSMFELKDLADRLKTSFQTESHILYSSIKDIDGRLKRMESDHYLNVNNVSDAQRDIDDIMECLELERVPSKTEPSRIVKRVKKEGK